VGRRRRSTPDRADGGRGTAGVGCFCCLRQALGEFDAVAATAGIPPAAAAEAARGAMTATLMLEMRVREIGQIGGSDTGPARKARQIARRQDQMAAVDRGLGTSWFNAAGAHFNLAHADEARRFAERVAGDERFAERAKEMLQRLASRP
jgi:hypothetical protein